MPLITCENASFAYEGKEVISNLNFEINPGYYLCIVGENGSGKSTLIKGLLRLKQPSQGRVINGSGLNPNEIGYLPQQTLVQKDFPASVFEVVISGCLTKRGFFSFYRKSDIALAIKNMKLLDIMDIKNKCYRELSGGQQQRVLLARALCATKKMVLLDEPVAGLDPMATHDLYHLIADINTNMGITVIMVSHDIKCAVSHSSHILHLSHTQLFFGKTSDYINSPMGRKFLGGK